MKQLLIIAILSFFVAGCSKDDTENSPSTISRTQWQSIENIDWEDIAHFEKTGFITLFYEYEFIMSYYDEKFLENIETGEGLYYTYNSEGTYQYNPPILTLTTKDGINIQYKVTDGKMTLKGKDKEFPEPGGTNYPKELFISPGAKF